MKKRKRKKARDPANNMTNQKVYGIKETDFFQFIKKINNFYASVEKNQGRIFATQTFVSYDEGINFYAVIYYSQNNQKKDWKSEPASQKQKNLLREKNIKFAENITKGEVSDLLNKQKGGKNGKSNFA